MIVLYLLTGGTTYWWWWAYKKRETLLKYEFENRTSGGVVEFKNYEDAKKHDNFKGRLEAQMKIAGTSAVVMFIITWMAYSLSKISH